jgi:hypothetical protein
VDGEAFGARTFACAFKKECKKGFWAALESGSKLPHS